MVSFSELNLLDKITFLEVELDNMARYYVDRGVDIFKDAVSGELLQNVKSIRAIT